MGCQVMDKLYQATPNGYCGDEDNGQTSAWYVFSSLGFYSVCPTSDQYVVGAPLFKQARINLENGKKVCIDAPANGTSSFYVKNMEVNGEVYSKNYLTYDELMKGMKIVLI